jgi:hypothetical protein
MSEDEFNNVTRVADFSKPMINESDIMPGGWIERLIKTITQGGMPRFSVLQYLYQHRPAKMLAHNGTLTLSLTKEQAVRIALVLQRGIVGSDLQDYCKAHGLNEEDYNGLCIAASFVVDAADRLQRQATVTKS